MKKDQVKPEVEVLHLFRWFTHTRIVCIYIDINKYIYIYIYIYIYWYLLLYFWNIYICMYLGSVCRKNWFIIHSQRPAYACVHMEHFEHTDAQLGPKPFQSAWKVSPGEHPTGTVMPTSMVVACRSTGRVSVGENGKRCASSCVGRGVLWFSMTFQFYWKLILLRDIKAAHAESVDCFGISNITEKKLYLLPAWLVDDHPLAWHRAR